MPDCGSNSHKRKRHFYLRLSSYVFGVLLFFAPFALYSRVIKWILKDPTVSDIHSICLRMQINWLFDPSQWYRFTASPIYLSFFVLIGSAFLLGPVFCGWLCSAGAITEYLSKLVPDRFKIDLSGKVNPTPIRYGFLAGYILTPFFGGGIGCAFCNYSVFQKFVSGLTGNFQVLAYWGSTMIITTILWFFLFGLFMKGGRGWCNFGCPVGAIQSITYAIGSKLRFTFKLKYDSDKCNNCGACVKACSMWSITKLEKGISVSSHTCNVCLDCVAVCATGALTYGAGAVETKKLMQIDDVSVPGAGK